MKPRRKRHPSGDVRSRVKKIRPLARKIFTTDGAVTQWLLSPAPALGGRKPIEVVNTDDGASEVESVLNGIAEGNVM